jgi:hypothetical protein
LAKNLALAGAGQRDGVWFGEDMRRLFDWMSSASDVYTSKQQGVSP